MDNFLQSREWARFQEELGRKTYWIDNILVVRHNLPFAKSYLEIRRADLNKEQLNRVDQLARREKAIFLRLEPLTNLPDNNFLKTRSYDPEKTLVLDLNKTEKALFSKMHPKTRYNIRLAKKHNILVKQSESLREVEIFWQLAKKTEKRNHFKYYPLGYYLKLIELLGRLKMACLLIAFYQNKPVASNIVLFYQKTAFYLFGASDYQYRQVMAPHFLQWETIKEAKKRGCLFYDFWGIDRERWPGITRFKKGFGGKELIYPGTFELPYNRIWYRIYRLAKNL